MGRRRGISGAIGAICFLLLAACQAPLNPIVPVGQAGYDTIDGAQPDIAARYALQAGDVLSISVFDEPELSQDEVAIDAAGNLSLPLIGDVRASGSSATQLARIIEQAYGANYLRNPRVAVAIKKARDMTVAVEGQVNLPGIYPWREGDTLLTALAQARSPTDVAKLDQILVFRMVDGQRYGGQFDLQAIRGGRMPDLALLPGDVVVVGYSGLRGAYKDVLQTAPLVAVLRPL
jgi:polysaccharide export outer membrane protein